MATERLPMRHVREILRLKWRLKRSHRETARSLGISAGAVASVWAERTHGTARLDVLFQALVFAPQPAGRGLMRRALIL